MSPIRVLIVAPWGERDGGAEQMLWVILRHLDRSVVEPEVGFLSSGPFVREVASLEIPTFVIPSGRLRSPFAYVRTLACLSRLIRSRQPDLVVSWSAKAHLYQGVAAMLTGRRRRAVWWQHAIATGNWLELLATLIPAAAVGCSSRACAEAQGRLRPKRRVFVVHPGVETLDATQSVVRADLAIPDDAWVIGTVGRLEPSKSQHKVIGAVADLRRAGIPAVGLLVGGTAFGLSLDYGAELRRLALDLGVVEHVVFTGQVADTTPYYQLMDVFMSPSDSESFGVAIVEAMAAGVPVVALARGGPEEIIESGVTGVLVEDEHALGVLRGLASNPISAKHMGERGREAACRFSPERSAARLEGALIAIAEQGDRKVLGQRRG